ncbi:MAG TPA: NTP transferase domain-containing protein [Candidatus Binatia bacterium]|nr:NTP transferase domain-containing protein [Candidatus Binatia bacterium]
MPEPAASGSSPIPSAGSAAPSAGSAAPSADVAAPTIAGDASTIAGDAQADAQGATLAPRTVGLVLAAGSGTRFGPEPSAKLLAPFLGRPLVEHVVGLAAAAGLGGLVVVLGRGAAALEGAVDWHGADLVRNPEPERGLASSLRLGVEAIRTRYPAAEAILVFLADQPTLRSDVVAAILAEAARSDRPVLVPRYAEGGGPNPVLVRRPAWDLVDATSGDRGLGPLLAARPELVAEASVPGANPDVDTPLDLVLLEWAERVRRNREQVDRFREVPDGPDFYGPVSSLFRSDPRRTDDPVLDALLAVARPTDRWLDIGAGAGRFALPLALRVREVVALDPSPGMLAALREEMAAHGITNVRPIEARWPLDDPARLAELRSDVALIAHLGYDIEAIGPFVTAMEAAAGRLCVAVLMERQPSAVADAFWPPIHGEARVALPALADFLRLLEAMGRAFEVERFPRPPRGFDSLDQLLAFLRRQLWVAEGGEKDRRLVALVGERAVERDGRWFVDERTVATGVVSWRPPAAA